jgi:hypothetical protein
MSIYDVIAKEQAATQAAKTEGRGNLSKEEYAAKKQGERDALYESLDETAMRVIGSGDELKAYLDTAARFPQYSANNQLLIFEAMPEATQIDDFNSWKEQGTPVQGKESSVITILKKSGEYERADGTTGTNYNLHKVFDISQTSAKPKVQEQHSLEDLIKALVHGKDVNIKFVDSLSEQRVAHFDKTTNTISLVQDIKPEPLFKSLARELAMANFAKGNPACNRADHVIAATLATYTLCQRYGVDNSTIDFNKLTPALASVQTPEEAREFLKDVRDATKELSGTMAKTLDKKAVEQIAPTSVAIAPIKQRSDRGVR